MRRTTLFIALLAISTMLLVACSTRTTTSDDDQTDDSAAVVTETPAITPDADDAESDLDTDAVDDSTDGEPPVEEEQIDEPITPEGFFLVSEAGEQPGWPRNYFWSDPDENVAMEMQGHYVPLPEEPLQVEAGETVMLEWERDDIDPEEISITVYPREDNFEENVGTRDGDSDAFFPHTDPLLTEDIDPGSPEWTVDLEEGEYFLLIDTLWPTPEEWPRDREAQFGFWIVVE